MEEMAGGLLPESFSPINKSLKASPYSILRKSDEIEVQETMEKMHERALAANHGGARTTRTELQSFADRDQPAGHTSVPPAIR